VRFGSTAMSQASSFQLRREILVREISPIYSLMKCLGSFLQFISLGILFAVGHCVPVPLGVCPWSSYFFLPVHWHSRFCFQRIGMVATAAILVQSHQLAIIMSRMSASLAVNVEQPPTAADVDRWAIQFLELEKKVDQAYAIAVALDEPHERMREDLIC